MLAPLLTALLAILPPPSRAAAVAAAVREAPPGPARAVAVTRALLGAPYLASPLGEERGPDPDPRFRLDAFDCMTFVETAVALGSSGSLEEARLALDDVRYVGPPALENRNHEVMSQWIPANVAKGWIRDVAAEVTDGRGPVAEKRFTPETWEAVRRAGRGLRGVPRDRLPMGAFTVRVVPGPDLPAIAGRIEPGTIAFVVRADGPDRATRITHLGIVVRGGDGAPRVRHATSSAGVVRVIEETLARFVLREQRAYPRWPVVGLALYGIRDNRARVAALLAPAPVAARHGVTAPSGRAEERVDAPAATPVPTSLP